VESQTVIVFLTIDLDLMDYLGRVPINEFEQAVSLIRECLRRFPEMCVTWFVRVDEEITTRFGSPDHCLSEYAELWASLRAEGHEVGWHYHPPIAAENSAGGRRIDERMVVEGLLRLFTVARGYGLDVVRVGYGYQTNATIAVLEKAGFRVDSSAVPRPSYPWDPVFRDWQGAPQEPFRPSRKDYRAPGQDHRNIVELPISTVPLPCLSDTIPNVQRYVNPAYRHGAFVRACDAAAGRTALTLVMHAYEILSRPEAHHLLAFDIKDFRRNLEHLVTLSSNFRCVSEAATLW
jgi:hypothetical protein